MTNYEMMKNLSIESMALCIMCPFESCFIDAPRCDYDDNPGDRNCGKCCLDWLGESCED